VVTLVLARAYQPKAREESKENKPIISGAARVSRDATGNVVIAMGAVAQKEIGITTEILEPVVLPIEVEAYGFVLDPAPLSKLNADLTGTQASLDAASTQYRRTRRLYAEQKNASLRDLQAARAAYLSDKVRVEALKQELLNDWGRRIAQIDSRARSQLIAALIDRREAIARVTAPIGAPLDNVSGRADVFVLGHEQQALHARAVYGAPTINPQMQGQTFLVLIPTGEFLVTPGTALSARLRASDQSEQGVIVPRTAVVRFAGKEWIYRELAGDRFVRREIVPAELAASGYFVTENLPPGMRIVVGGAESLLSEELKSQIEPGE
jgi:hypothetical protein